MPTRSDEGRAGELSLAQARMLVDGALDAATDMGCEACVTVVDAGGLVVMKARSDAVSRISIEMSECKAFTAAMVEMPTGDLYDLVQPGGPFYGFTGTQGGRIVAFAGGLPLRRDGRVTGGIGVSGGSAEQDGAIAAQAIERLEGVG